MKLTVQNAEIKTATVEVKTLTISGKQVTQAVFRQLQEEPLVTSDGKLNGVPWGIVNYHPDKCSDSPSHLHVVWQSGADLRRAAVRHPAYYFQPLKVDDAEEFAQWLYCQNGHVLPRSLTRNRDSTFAIDDIRIEARHFFPRNHDEFDSWRCKKPERVAEAVSTAVADAKQRRWPYSDRWLELNDLPQLFIAV